MLVVVGVLLMVVGACGGGGCGGGSDAVHMTCVFPFDITMNAAIGVTKHLGVRLPASPPPPESSTTNNCWPSRALQKKSALNVRVDGVRKMP